mmetsp:Transcript_36323/g.78408  ORF Transcript_36323/g.78408 Transcript_36323/m.78408 type:complete len:117 (-) Transcript_36323:356-706(-)
MGHGTNKQKTQKIGFGQEPKETREERRRRIAQEARARDECHKILPHVLGIIVFLILAFSLYVRCLPRKIYIEDAAAAAQILADMGSDMTFEEVELTEMGFGDEQDPDVINLDGDAF